ncbi:DUF202 domain-containing protein [Nocardia sp. CA-129566]|uniref:DUF202 domain-containing protein n=1 Tax=Nocardia sp. CA-129566 TaxID=3239976 RepID=UPI003D982796
MSEGLAAERTALSWRRTATSAMAIAALLLNHAVTSGWRPTAVAAIGAAITMAALAGLCFSRNRTLHEGRFGHGRGAVAATTVAVLVVAVIVAVIASTEPPP